MGNKKITKAELELCFERLLNDAQDDFFPDPFRYKDLRLLRDELLSAVHEDLKQSMKQDNIHYTKHQFYDWDVPKGNFVVRHAVSLHPYDRLAYHFILNRLVPIIEPRLSKARYSYRVNDPKSKNIFGKRPIEHWIKFKEDIRDFFTSNQDYEYLASTDVAGFFEYIPIVHFKKQMQQLSRNTENTTVELLNKLLRGFSVSSSSGIPQGCDPSSYLCSAFLDFLDKDLEANSLKHFRYVDDIRVACKTKNDAKKAIVQVIRSLRAKTLNVSAAKTKILHKDDAGFRDFVEDFPPLLSKIDTAVAKKHKPTINTLAPQLIELTKQVMKEKTGFNERLFRACIWRIVKIHYFKNIGKFRLETISKRCLRLMESMPGRSDSFLGFLVLQKNRKYVQDELYSLLLDCVYPWQEMRIWELLIQCDTIKNSQIIELAKQRSRDMGYPEPARDHVIIFLGKHGDYQDKEYIASIFPHTQSFRAMRCIIIALQEYADRTSIYNQIMSANTDLLLVSLVRYIKQLNSPEYIVENKNIGSDLAISS